MDIASVLSDYYDLPVNQWIKISQIITAIYLDQDANIYTDDCELYYFDTTTNLLSISRNFKYKKLTKIEPKGSYKPYIYVDMSKITGFVGTSVLGPYGTMIERPF